MPPASEDLRLYQAINRWTRYSREHVSRVGVWEIEFPGHTLRNSTNELVAYWKTQANKLFAALEWLILDTEVYRNISSIKKCDEMRMLFETEFTADCSFYLGARTR